MSIFTSYDRRYQQYNIYVPWCGCKEWTMAVHIKLEPPSGTSLKSLAESFLLTPKKLTEKAPELTENLKVVDNLQDITFKVWRTNDAR